MKLDHVLISAVLALMWAAGASLVAYVNEWCIGLCASATTLVVFISAIVVMALCCMAGRNSPAEND